MDFNSYFNTLVIDPVINCYKEQLKELWLNALSEGYQAGFIQGKYPRDVDRDELSDFLSLFLQAKML